MMKKRKKKKKKKRSEETLNRNKSISTRSQKLLNFVAIFISKFSLQMSLCTVEDRFLYKYETKKRKRKRREKKNYLAN